MAALIRTLFKSKKAKREEEPATDIIFQPCNSRQPTARFADDCQLPSATSAYHTTTTTKRRKGPQSCPGGIREESEVENGKKKSSFRRKPLLSHSSRQDFMIDAEREPQLNPKHHRSRPDLRGHSQYDLHLQQQFDNDENHREAMKSQFYLHKWEDSERQRKEEKRKQEQLEKERNSIQNAMSNMAICMASVQQMEQLKKERDQYRKEMSRYKNKCEKLESKCEQLETAAMSPSYAGFQQPFFHQPSPYQTPQYPPPPMTFAYPNTMSHRQQPPPSMGPLSSQYPPPNFGTATSQLFPSSTRSSGASHPSSFALSHASTTISDGAGEALANPSDFSFLRNSFLNAPSQILSGPVPLASSTMKASDRRNFAFYDDEEDEVKNFRVEQPLPTPSPYSEMTQSSDNDNVV